MTGLILIVVFLLLFLPLSSAVALLILGFLNILSKTYRGITVTSASKFLIWFFSPLITIFIILTIFTIGHWLFPLGTEITVANYEKNKICLTSAKIGEVSYLNNVELDGKDAPGFENAESFRVFDDTLNTSNEIFISYYRGGKCGKDSTQIHHFSCIIENRQYCRVEIHPSNLDCICYS